MADYRTKQRELIISYLKSCPLPHITAGDIVLHLRAEGAKIGIATVYRQLERMVESGLVRSGELLHVDCSYLNALAPHILEHHGFEVDNSRTVMYGLCRRCREGGGEE